MGTRAAISSSSLDTRAGFEARGLHGAAFMSQWEQQLWRERIVRALDQLKDATDLGLEALARSSVPDAEPSPTEKAACTK